VTGDDLPGFGRVRWRDRRRGDVRPSFSRPRNRHANRPAPWPGSRMSFGRRQPRPDKSRASAAALSSWTVRRTPAPGSDRLTFVLSANSDRQHALLIELAKFIRCGRRAPDGIDACQIQQQFRAPPFSLQAPAGRSHTLRAGTAGFAAPERCCMTSASSADRRVNDEISSADSMPRRRQVGGHTDACPGHRARLARWVGSLSASIPR